MQLESLKDIKVEQDAAARFLVKAERESTLDRKISYLRNAESLYTKLYEEQSKARYLINKRKVLLGLKRLFPQDNRLSVKIENNLKQFTSLASVGELLVAISFFDREINLATDRRKKIELLNVSLTLFGKLTTKGDANEYLGKMHKVILQLKKLDPGNVNLHKYNRTVEQGLSALSKESELLEAISLYDQWAKKNTDLQLQQAYAQQEAVLYKKLIKKSPVSHYAIGAYKFSDQWKTVQPKEAINFQAWLWNEIATFSEEQIKAWGEYIAKEYRSNATPKQIDLYMGNLLCQKKWNSNELNSYAYKQAIVLVKRFLLEKDFSQAKKWLVKAKELDSQKPQAFSIEVLYALSSSGIREAKAKLKDFKDFTYNAKPFSNYMDSLIRELEAKGFTHPELGKLKKKVGRM